MSRYCNKYSITTPHLTAQNVTFDLPNETVTIVDIVHKIHSLESKIVELERFKLDTIIEHYFHKSLIDVVWYYY